MPALLSESVAETIVGTARATVGDSLRTIISFTPDQFELLYLRADLYDGRRVTARAAKVPLVESERAGFDATALLEEFASKRDDPDGSTYTFTIRIFSDGYVSRVIVGDRGILVTSDDVEVDAFEDMAVALRAILADVEQSA